jgi:hypothetical protein
MNSDTASADTNDSVDVEYIIHNVPMELVGPQEQIPGGMAFVEKMVRDIVDWTNRVASPAFMICTEWITASGDSDKHYSLLIQYEAEKVIDLQPMQPTSSPSTTTKAPLQKRARVDNEGEHPINSSSSSSSKQEQLPMTRVQPARWCLTNSPLKSRRRITNGLRCLCVDVNDPSRHLFYLENITDVLQILRESLKVDLASVGIVIHNEGHDEIDPPEMEVNPRLYMIDHEGFLVRMRINRAIIGAENLPAWSAMVTSQLAVVKLLSGKGKGHGAPL